MSIKIAGKLLSQRRFAPLFVLLQTGTFNDFVHKNALISLITFGGLAFLVDVPSAARVPIAAFIFTGPFLLVTAIAGQIADKIDRGVILRWVKRVEVFIMLLAGIGFVLVDVRILAFSLGLMGAQSAFFTPTKNTVLPQWVGEKELITGNALLNGFVFVVMLVGQIIGTLFVLKSGGPQLIGALLLGLALIGCFAAEFCPPAPAPNPNLKINFEPLSASWRVLARAWQAPDVLRPMLGIAWFYGLSTVFITMFPDYVATILRFDVNVLIVLLGLSTLSILIGSLMTMLIAKWKIWGQEAIGISALGIAGVTVFTGMLYLLPSPTYQGDTLGALSAFWAHENTPGFLVSIIGAALCSGMYVVPLQAMAQRRADPKIRARLMSAGAILLNLLVNVMTFALIGIAAAQLTPKTPFLLVICFSFIVSCYAIYRCIRPTARPNFMTNE